MDRSHELRLPTIAVPVRLAIVGAEPATSAELFVVDVPRGGRGRLIEDVAAMLDEPAAWLPVRMGAVRLFAKHAIAWIALRRHVDGTHPASDFSEEPSEVTTLYDHQHAVEVQLATGARLRGTLLDSSPADRSRVMDHLNSAGRFVRLWTPDEHYLVSVAQITAVTELAENAV